MESAQMLQKLEAPVDDGERLSAEADCQRAELNKIVPNTSRKLADVRSLTFELKHLVKPRVAPSHWLDYGIPDKR